jgi:PKD repeat protein
MNLKNKTMKKITYLFIATLIGFASCEPFQSEDIVLEAAPDAPQFTMEALPNDPNTIVFKDLSGGNYARVWDFGESEEGKTPLKRTSTLTTDTVTYLKAGTYVVTLHVSAANGGGTAQSSKTLIIENDGQQGCDPKIALLTGDCLPAGKCWTFSTVAGAIGVGPNQGDVSWYNSPLNGLVTDQYDDSFCFFIDGGKFQYNNNGQTIDPFNGYIPVAYTPPTDHTWTFSPGTGAGGRDQVTLTVGSFLGVWDASNVYDIVTLTENELVVETPFLNGGGWFKLYFVAQ